MKKLILSLSFAFLAFFAFGTYNTAQAQLESPVPLSEVMPISSNSALYGVPWSQSTDDFVFSYTLEYKRCSCSGGKDGIGSKAIQTCLNDLNFIVAHSGPGSPGRETNCVGPMTVDAVDRFQQYFGFEEKGVDHFGGYTAKVGDVTQVLMNHLCFGESGANDARSYVPGTTQSTVSSGGGSRSGGSRNSTTIIYQNGDDNGNGGGADAEITMTKRVVPANASEGDVVTFYFDLATNNGGSHTGITITDNLAGLGPITCGGVANGSVSMSGNSTLTCSASYTATSSPVINTASVTSSDDSTPDTGSAALTVEGDNNGAVNDPQITIAKALAGAASVEEGGNQLTFTITLTANNDGAHSNVQVVDNPSIGTVVSNNCPSNVASGATVTCQVVYQSPADVNGDTAATNTATVQSTEDMSLATSNSVNFTVTDSVVAGTPQITIAKALAGAASVEEGGNQLTFTITLTANNDGAHSNVQVVDNPSIGTVVSNNCPSNVASGATVTCQVVYQSPADVNGDTAATNTATVQSTEDMSLATSNSVNFTVTDSVVACNNPDNRYIGVYQPDTYPNEATPTGGTATLWGGAGGGVNYPPGVNTPTGSVVDNTTDFYSPLVTALNDDVPAGKINTVCEQDIRYDIIDTDTGTTYTYQPWASGCTYFSDTGAGQGSGVTLNFPFPGLDMGLPANFDPQGDNWTVNAYFVDPQTKYDDTFTFQSTNVIIDYQASCPE